jgi:hypothetical protein
MAATTNQLKDPDPIFLRYISTGTTEQWLFGHSIEGHTHRQVSLSSG